MATPIDSERDEKLYVELNSHSKTMRQSATDFAQQLSKSKSKSPDIQQLIGCLNKIASVDIKSMDSALLDFKRCMETLERGGDDAFTKSVMPSELPDILMKYATFVDATITLAEKANELNNSAS